MVLEVNTSYDRCTRCLQSMKGWRFLLNAGIEGCFERTYHSSFQMWESLLGCPCIPARKMRLSRWWLFCWAWMLWSLRFGSWWTHQRNRYAVWQSLEFRIVSGSACFWSLCCWVDSVRVWLREVCRRVDQPFLLYISSIMEGRHIIDSK